MMLGIEDQFKPIAREYGLVESDAQKSRYELEVNWPSIRKLLPEPPARILDYGRGSGVYTRKLLADGYDVLGTDNAPDMIAQTDDIGDKTQLWTYQDAPIERTFDVIIAKLVVQFVEDLPRFAAAMRAQAETDGRLIISIPHPARSRRLLSDTESPVYWTEVGTSGLRVQMIHRELDEYKRDFHAANFELLKAVEPVDPADPTAEIKRLNMVYRPR